MLINKVLLSIGVKNDCIVVESIHLWLELESVSDVVSYRVPVLSCLVHENVL